jgi:hypothetical protein
MSAQTKFQIFINISVKIASTLIALLTALIFFTQVEVELTKDDIDAFLEESYVLTSKPNTYEQEIEIISRLQRRVIERFPINEGIPLYQEREPRNLNFDQRGLCYDRARYLEKLLSYYGFHARHIYLLQKKGKGFLHSFLTKGHPSHAVTHVKTLNGWLVVDSSTNYLALDSQGLPIPLRELEIPNEILPEAYRAGGWAIIGLYSRHGAFFKPYVPLPEINLKDFLGNFAPPSLNKV